MMLAGKNVWDRLDIDSSKQAKKYRRLCSSIEVINRIMLYGFIVLIATTLLGAIGFTFLVVPLAILYFLLMIIGVLWKLLLKRKEKLGAKLSEHGVNVAVIDQQIEEKFKKKDKETNVAVKPTNMVKSTVSNTVTTGKITSNRSTIVNQKAVTAEKKSAEDSASVFISTSDSASQTVNKIGDNPVEKTDSGVVKIENIEQSVSISNGSGVEKDMHPGGISKYSEEGDKDTDLFWMYDYKYSGWGISEKVCIDSITGQVFYIATQYDGQIAAQTWLLEKSPISYDEMYELAKKYAKGNDGKFKDITKNNWKKLLNKKK